MLHKIKALVENFFLNTDTATVSKSDVVEMYREILGREPENEQVVLDKVKSKKDKVSLIKEFINSGEFKRIIASKDKCIDLSEKEGIFINKHDFPIIFPATDKIQLDSILATGSYQLNEFKLVLHYLREQNYLTGNTFLDIGANVGTHTIYALKEPEFKQVIAVEPSEANLSFLNFNLLLNQVKERVNVIPAALGETNKKSYIVRNPTNCGDYRIEPSSVNHINLFKEESFSKEEVDVITLDNLLESHTNDINNIAFIWMDTQGSEGLILGDSKKIREIKVPLYIEFWPYGMDRLNSYEMLKKFILNHVKSIVRFVNNKACIYQPQEIDNIYNEFKGTSYYCDLLLIRE